MDTWHLLGENAAGQTFVEEDENPNDQQPLGNAGSDAVNTEGIPPVVFGKVGDGLVEPLEPVILRKSGLGVGNRSDGERHVRRVCRHSIRRRAVSSRTG